MANTIVIDTQLLEDLSRQIMQVKNSLSSISGNVTSSLSEVRRVAPDQPAIINKLVRAKNNLSTTINHTQKLSKAVGDAAVLWAAAENKILSNKPSEGEAPPTENGSGSSGSSAADIALKIIGKAGFAGAMIEGIGNAVKAYQKWKNGKMDAAAWASLAKDTKGIVNTISDVLQAAKNSAKIARTGTSAGTVSFWKKMFGLNNKKGPLSTYSGWSKASSFGSRMWTNFKNSFTWDNFKKPYTKGGATSAFAWAGVALSAVSNGISNYTEWKSGEITGKRAVMETITETVVDVGKNWAIGTAVACTLAATPIGAPVLLVGATTVAVTMGLDALSNKFFGKTTTELISDAVLDVGQAVVKKSKEVVAGFRDMVGSIGRGIGALFA